MTIVSRREFFSLLGAGIALSIMAISLSLSPLLVSDNVSPELTVAETSPAGDAGGYIIPASCESGYEHFLGGCGPVCVPNAGASCSGGQNACGVGSSGTIQCDGVCGNESPGDSYGGWTITGSPPPDTCDGILGRDHDPNDGFNGAYTCPAGATISCQDASWNCYRGNCATYVRPVTCSASYIPASAPALPPSYGQACTSENICGQGNPGTIQCDGSCSGTPPPLPGNYGQNCLSPANSCGLRNGGSIGCGGTCSAQFPPPESQCGNVNAGGGGTGTTLTLNPPTVLLGGFTDLTWQSDEDSCLLYNATSGALLATSTAGTKREGPINSTRRYVLNCDPDIVSVTVIPQLDFEEF